MTAPTRLRQPTLRQLRQARGWSQAVLAGRLRVAKITVSHWERGVSMPRPAMQQRLADLFGVRVGEIDFGQGEEQS